MLKVENIAPKYLDHHSLTMDILLKRDSDFPPSTRDIRWHVVSEIRKRYTELKAMEEYKNLLSQHTLIERSLLEKSERELEKLIGFSHLSNNEKQILYLRYWERLTIEQISQNLQISPQETNRVLWDTIEKLKSSRRILESQENQEDLTESEDSDD